MVRVCTAQSREALPMFGMSGRSRGMWARSKSGLVSVTCCSEINIFCLWCMCTNRASQQFIFVPFLQGFNSFSVSYTEPNSCLLSKMCMAYAEVGMLFLMYHRCSLCLTVIDLPDCPPYVLLHVLHLSWYSPLVLVLLGFCESCCSIVLVGQKANKNI